VTVTADIALASSSPRRTAILSSAGVSFEVVAPGIDDADLPTVGRDPARVTMALAWFKARQSAAAVHARWGQSGPRFVVAADTLCEREGAPVGKPRDEDDARAMLREFRGRAHRVHTGLCILDRAGGGRRILGDSATVGLGHVADADLDDYVRSGEWAGKSGGYNYADRVRAGWPLSCDGDPETVMGLPSRLVIDVLRSMGWRA
jgi:septum formation protein